MNDNEKISLTREGLNALLEEAVRCGAEKAENAGSDDEIKEKLADAVAALTGKGMEEEYSETLQVRPEAGKDPENGENPETEEEFDDEEVSPGSFFSDIFNGDSISGVAAGFLAGAAVVGGGVLLYKLITKD